MNRIFYRKVPKRWKYQLTKSYEHNLHFNVRSAFPSPETVASIPGQLHLYTTGRLLIENGYAWDGPSGPTFNTESSMRGSLVHDALYQLIREGLLPASLKPTCDRELRLVCIEDGMWRWRARLWEWMLVQFGWTAL